MHRRTVISLLGGVAILLIAAAGGLWEDDCCATEVHGVCCPIEVAGAEIIEGTLEGSCCCEAAADVPVGIVEAAASERSQTAAAGCPAHADPRARDPGASVRPASPRAPPETARSIFIEHRTLLL